MAKINIKIPTIPYVRPPREIYEFTPIGSFEYVNDIVKEIIEKGKTEVIRVNETGSRKSTKTESWLIASMWSIFQSKAKVDIVWVRNQVGDADELYTNFEEYLESYKLPVRKHSNKSKRVMKYRHNQIRVLGLETGRVQTANKTDIKVGIKRAKGKDVCIIVLEERHQITDDKVQAVREALGGYAHTLEIHISNPWQINNDYIRYCNQAFKYDPKQLRKDLEQFNVRKIYNQAGEYLGKEIFHYSTHFLNPYISPTERHSLTNLEKTDPKRSAIANWGIPGVLEGTIYSGYIEQVEDPTMRNKPEYYVVGVDFGHKRDAWAVVFGGVGFDNAYIEVYDEFVHNNYNEVRNYTINELIDKTVEKIITWINTYQANENRYIEVKCDYAWPGAVALLKNAIRMNELDHIVSVRDCRKDSINKRIDNTTLGMSLGRIKINKKNAPKLIEEFETIIWDQSKTTSRGEPRREDKGDHSINAFEYMADNELDPLVRDYGDNDLIRTW